MLNENHEANGSACVLDRVLAIANEVFGRPVNAEDNFFDIGGDSVCAISFAVRMEEIFGVEPDIDTILAIENFAEFARVIIPSLTADGGPIAQLLICLWIADSRPRGGQRLTCDRRPRLWVE